MTYDELRKRVLKQYRDMLNDETLDELRSLCIEYNVRHSQRKFMIVEELARKMTDADIGTISAPDSAYAAEAAANR